ncbi:sensor domain-containing phosphodiesterase [Lichenifustis flavocetrariae]|uniref:EAL domain-containing protein n=1 Tax=Lichenifustis flavocetrariae TaxID=2949735 RepID=A0AA41YXL5_9HYPH|nr:EAL domain-containing protein [Lichenifustis flavocetrariae]MCW6509999.1 EAL domain-containing protein [Lichenifustis flavocetrariae]
MSIVPAPVNEAARITSLLAHAILDTGPDTYLDSLTRIAARRLKAPIVLINVVGEDRQWAKAAFGLPRGYELPRDLSFCAYAILTPSQPTIIADTLTDARVATNPLVTGKPGFRFYAGAPITDGEGRALGALCVLDTRPRDFNQPESRLLLEIAESVSARLELYRTMAALNESQQRFKDVVELNTQIPWTASATGESEEAAGHWLSLVGLPDEESTSRGWVRMVHPEDLPKASAAWAASVRDGHHLDLDYRVRLADGGYRWFRVRAAPQRDAMGVILRWYGTVEDIHDRKVAEIAHGETEVRLRLALDIGRLRTWELDLASRRLTASDVSVLNFGLQLGAEVSSHDAALSRMHPDDEKRYGREVRSAWTSGQELDIEYRSIWPDGTVHWIRIIGHPTRDGEGKAVRLIGLSLDITAQRTAEDERQQAEARTAYIANHDPLTGLANRRRFHRALAEALSAASSESKVALLCIDLLDFKTITDAMGAETGDNILQHAAERLKASVGTEDLVARYSSDEFAVLLRSVSLSVEVDKLALRLLQSLEEPISLADQILVLGGSIGISVAPDDATNSLELLRNANAALVRTKASGRGGYQFFDPAADVRLQALADLKLSLRDALARDEFHLVYQPVIDAVQGTVSSFEALIRWQHPERGLVSPADFIPLAEETGWIIAIGGWVLREACKQAATWPEGISVAVNFSAVQFEGRNMEAEIGSALKDSGLAPGRLVIELTETILLQDDDAKNKALRALRGLGVRIAMDDFGTGYSSLGYLRRFPFDTIKIDQSLVRGLPDGAGGDAIVYAVISLAHSLGISVTAEGVETPAQFELLRQQGASHVQGYLFSRPVQASEIPSLLTRRFAESGDSQT